jgi:hypothetical protein
LSGFGFDDVDCEVILNSASELKITVTGQLSGAVRSASTLRYRGNPAIDVSVESASELVDAN